MVPKAASTSLVILADRDQRGERGRPPRRQLREIDCGGTTERDDDDEGRFWQFSSDSAIAAQKEEEEEQKKQGREGVNGRGRFGRKRKGGSKRGFRQGREERGGDDPVL